MEPERAYDRTETLAQLVREMIDRHENPETRLDVSDWLRRAHQEVLDDLPVVQQDSATWDPWGRDPRR